MVTITLDGTKTKVDGKATIMQAAREAGIAIPSLCSHQGLSGLGNCRLCVVKVEKKGRKRIVTSCNYPVEEGLTVTTNSQKILAIRKMIIELLMARSPHVKAIREYAAAGVAVGLGVDGSASNDGSHMLAEVRQAMLLARVREGITGFSLSNDPGRRLMTARQALWLGTRGGAAVLGRSDIGSLEEGKCADFFTVRLDRLAYAGAQHDPLAAVVFCQSAGVDVTVVGGKFVVKEGRLMPVDGEKLVQEHNRAARRLLEP